MVFVKIQTRSLLDIAFVIKSKWWLSVEMVFQSLCSLTCIFLSMFPRDFCSISIALFLFITNTKVSCEGRFTCLQFVIFNYQICQRLMVQGLPGTAYCSGPFDVVRKVIKAEGFRGMYRGFGLTAVTQSPASALWWGVYGAAQHIIWRYSYIP